MRNPVKTLCVESVGQQDRWPGDGNLTSTDFILQIFWPTSAHPIGFRLSQIGQLHNPQKTCRDQCAHFGLVYTMGWCEQ